MGRSGKSSGGGRSFSGGGGMKSFSGGMKSSGRSNISTPKPSLSRSSLNTPSRTTQRQNHSPRVTNIFNNSGRYNTGGSRYNSGSYPPQTNRRKSSFSVLFFLILIIILLTAVFVFMNTGESKLQSTVERTALPLNASTEVSYYTDTLDWFSDPYTLESGLRYFYKSTGVQPHVYVVDNLEGKHSPNNQAVEVWMENKYNALFDDEAHLLMLFLDNGTDYGVWLMGGAQTKTVIDGEAQSIIYAYIDKYYYSDVTDEEMFSNAFTEAADAIMTVYVSPIPGVLKTVAILMGGIMFLIIITRFIAKKKKLEIEADKAATELLNTSVEKINENSEASQLAKKYETED